MKVHRRHSIPRKSYAGRSFSVGFRKLIFAVVFFSLLSNAVLPEANPLLELGSHVEEDFQKMLYDWETHMGALQAR